MDVSADQIHFLCKKCGSNLDELDYELDLMPVPTDDTNYSDEIAEIIIPVSQSSNKLHQIIDVLPSIDGHIGSAATLSKEIEIMNRVFEYLSGHSQVDHPLCQDCANLILREHTLDIRRQEEELTVLEDYLKQLQSNPSNLDEGDEELNELEKEEALLMKQLNELELQNNTLDDEIRSKEDQINAAEVKYDCLMMQYNNKKLNLWQLNEDVMSLGQRKRYLALLSERLKSTNMLDVVFPIWYQDNIATISGLRMGRLPEVVPPVEWTEINSAWGQCVLLLHNILRKLDFTLHGYRMFPCGSTSYIESLHDKKRYNLFQSGNSLFGITNNRFDQAMIVYLDCMNQVMQHIELHDKSFRFPYRVVDKFRLSDAESQSYSLKIGGNTDDSWTRALKFMLIDLNWMKTWLVKHAYKVYCDSLKSTATAN